MPHPILLYDGVCGLCNRFVRFILRRDPVGVFRFASLQSPVAGRVLARHGVSAEDIDTVYIVLSYNEPGEVLLLRSDAALFVLSQLGGIWRASALVLKVLPRPVRDFGYKAVAGNRYRIFGRYDTCPVPSAETRTRFLDI